MAYRYAHPHPAVATDIALFTVRDGRLALLLIKRKSDPFGDRWALPGGFLKENEDLDACALRELAEEAGVAARVLEHFGNFSAPDRDPRERVISIAYLALVDSTELTLKAATDAKDAGWFPVDRLPSLAFDHDAIVQSARRALKDRLLSGGLVFGLLPKRFTLTALQDAYEAVVGDAVDRRNFRKRVLSGGYVCETDALDRGSHRPARLYERAS